MFLKKNSNFDLSNLSSGPMFHPLEVSGVQGSKQTTILRAKRGAELVRSGPVASKPIIYIYGKENIEVLNMSYMEDARLWHSHY